MAGTADVADDAGALRACAGTATATATGAGTKAGELGKRSERSTTGAGLRVAHAAASSVATIKPPACPVRRKKERGISLPLGSTAIFDIFKPTRISCGAQFNAQNLRARHTFRSVPGSGLYRSNRKRLWRARSTWRRDKYAQ